VSLPAGPFHDFDGVEVFPTEADWCVGCGHMFADHTDDACTIPGCTPQHKFVPRPAYLKRDSE
jgi:hypothetical protein